MRCHHHLKMRSRINAIIISIIVPQSMVLISCDQSFWSFILIVVWINDHHHDQSFNHVYLCKYHRSRTSQSLVFMSIVPIRLIDGLFVQASLRSSSSVLCHCDEFYGWVEQTCFMPLCDGHPDCLLTIGCWLGSALSCVQTSCILLRQILPWS